MYPIEKKSAVKGASILGNGLNHFSYNKFTLKRLMWVWRNQKLIVDKLVFDNTQILTA